MENLPIDGVVYLSLVDARFSGDYVGVYCESARISLQNSQFHSLALTDTDEMEEFQATLTEGSS